MNPIDPLLYEHKLIAGMVQIMRQEINNIRKTGIPDPRLIDYIVDFFSVYSQNCHHGKEEEILFRELQKKDLIEKHRRMLDILRQEHQKGHKLVSAFDNAHRQYILTNDSESCQVIISIMSTLSNFIPLHIQKEEKQFFHEVMNYFSSEEMRNIIEEFDSVDKKVLHDKYSHMVEFWNEVIIKPE